MMIGSVRKCCVTPCQRRSTHIVTFDSRIGIKAYYCPDHVWPHRERAVRL